MIRADMKQIVKQFIGDIIERWEEDRALRTKITENEREATGLGLSDPSTKPATSYAGMISQPSHQP